MEDPRAYKRRLAREKFLNAMPRGERRRYLRDLEHGYVVANIHDNPELLKELT